MWVASLAMQETRSAPKKPMRRAALLRKHIYSPHRAATKYRLSHGDRADVPFSSYRIVSSEDPR
jgi:hypothetical protein